MSELIFVYGTLKRGFGNNRIIADQNYLGLGETVASTFQMYSLGGFPGVVRGSKTIRGELFEVDEEAFARCDRLEGHPYFYRREQVEVTGINGVVQLAWIYIYQGDTEGLREVEDWYG